VSELTPEGQRLVSDIAARHNLSEGVVETLLRAVVSGGGGMAQFSHPELGGMGQWSQGGMTMIGDMFNNALKAKVDAACSDLAAMVRNLTAFTTVTGMGLSGEWWPEGLGQPSTSGGQNDLRYAFFPQARRLAIDDAGRISVYDTGDHRIFGVSQQQGAGRSLVFTSQYGDVRLADLGRVDAPSTSSPPHPQTDAVPPAPFHRAEVQPVNQVEVQPAWSAPSVPPTANAAHEVLFASIERLAELHAKGILTQEEFTAKKTELLGRL